MFSSMHRTGSAVETGDSFVVRYSGAFSGFYLARILPLFFLFAALVLLYLDDDSRRLIFSRNTSAYKPFSWVEFSFLLALATAPLLDLVLTLRRVHRDALALSISSEGITGPVRHMTRLLTWREIADVAVCGKFLVVRREPRTLLQFLFSGRGLGDINVPVGHLDRDAEDILAAVHHFRPAQNHRPAAAN